MNALLNRTTRTLLLSSALACANIYAAEPLPIVPAQSQGFSSAGIARIDHFFANEISKKRMPGAVLAVARNGKLVIYKAYGQLDPIKNIPMPKDSIFNLASMTKVMAVTGALTFYEEGQLPLSAPISDWYPQFKNMNVGSVTEDGKISLKPAKKSITVQDLMRHTNGLTYGARGNTPIHQLFPGSSAGSAFEYDGAQFLNKLSSLPLLYEPATVWDYGFGIDVLGLIEEKIAGKRLDSILRERIWDKLGMSDTGFEVPDQKRSRLARPLEIDPITNKPQKLEILDKKTHFDCGGSCAFSTAADYIRFGQMLLNGGTLNQQQILSPKTVELMTSDHLGNSIQNNVAQTEPGRGGYGFGLGVAVRKERGLAASNGNVGDYTWNGANGTIFWVDPKEKLVVVMMSASPGEIRKIHREQLNAVIYGAMSQ